MSNKIKIHELAKELKINSKELLEKAKSLGIDAKSHLSSISEEEANKIERAMGKMGKEKNNEVKSEKKKEMVSEQPVIIRREVIINDQEEKKTENKKKENKKGDIGFVENNRNKDYNIVYREKTKKPMSVAEFFGISKKEDKKNEEKTVAKKVEEKEIVEKKTEIEVEENKTEKSAEKTTKVEEKEKVVKKEISKTDTRSNQRTDNRRQDNNYQNKNNGNYQNRSNNNHQNRNNNYQGRNGNNNYQNRNNGNYQNRNNDNRNFGGQRKLDDRGIDKKINNIMSADIIEKESVREYANKAIDKQKSNRNYNNDDQKSKKNKKRGNSEEFSSDKLRHLKKESTLSNVDMLDYYDLSTQRGRRSEKKIKQENRTKQKIFKLTEITIPSTITVKDLASEMKITSSDVIKKLLTLGAMVTINQEIDFDMAYLVASEFGITAKKKDIVKEEDLLFDNSEDNEDELINRAPVVCVMGHVDHGKTSLLDAIRSTNVIEGESGGITQHIGAYKVEVNGRPITFLDTPGHEAFTSMRARGAQITDIVILVVAANDGVMPQTIEAINHAKAAEVPIIVAVNKIDLEGANVEKIKQSMTEYELVPEEWGGNTIFVPISAKKNIGIDNLLEMVLLQADMLELKVNPNKQAKGTIIEAKLDKSRGPVATMLVQRGKLDVGDTIVVGSSIGRIRAMTNDKGVSVHKARTIYTS